MSPASQQRNLAKIQSQILKMAQDARVSGEMQVWANRQNVLPEVRAFAERHGVRVEERLRTGNTNLRPGDRSFQDFANRLDKELRAQARWTAVAGSVKAGMGAYLAYRAILQLEKDVADFGDTQGDWLRIGEHGSTLLAGGALGTAGAAQLARQLPALSNSARLVSLTRWGGRLGVAGTVLAEGFLVGQYLSGDLTERQFWHGQSSLGGGLAGALPAASWDSRLVLLLAAPSVHFSGRLALPSVQASGEPSAPLGAALVVDTPAPISPAVASKASTGHKMPNSKRGTHNTRCAIISRLELPQRGAGPNQPLNLTGAAFWFRAA